MTNPSGSCSRYDNDDDDDDVELGELWLLLTEVASLFIRLSQRGLRGFSDPDV